jgi:hypothetical protein
VLRRSNESFRSSATRRTAGPQRPLVPFTRPSDPFPEDPEPYIWKTATSGHTVLLFTVFQ